MKKIFGLLSILAILAGCSSYNADNLSDFLKDPHFAKHQEALDELEHEYLQKKITYAEYQTRKKDLENNYDREVKIREGKIHEE